ncbi:uncharacterized protein PV09_06856 [Verruconis gallopava]|uniref:CWH43-like N-terminal domain-containing protein n=1 Tax=Verruconis gallopava TaxID=253628 RepID=A0A0D2A4G1_9PEZI|nr:uncharacterized protein PV09_06856 [Verruconis gallopava]KIW01673.1 hypothetical protein PV09_06856 [Verruconis gallopava]
MRFPYWLVPIFSATVWLAMLLAMLLTWVVDGKPHLPTMDVGQVVPFISDIGAWKMKPVFIAMGTVTVVSFDLAFISERWLRHRGKLTPNTSVWQKTFAVISIIASVVGAAGLILLTIFDALHHPNVHDICLVLFIGGYVVSAIFVCAEYQRLGIHYRQFRILRISFWIKLAFILIEVGLAIGFGVATTNNNNHRNTAGIFEWVVALVYSFYVMSYFLDFLPAFSKNGQTMTTEEMAMQDSAAPYAGRERYDGGALPYQNQDAYSSRYAQQTRGWRV